MRRETLWRMLLAAFFCATLPQLAQATDITVDGTACTLADAITAANTDTATGGCHAGSGDDTITLQTDVTLIDALSDITSTITIEGGGHFISGNNDAAVFSVLRVGSNGKLSLKKTNITGGKVSDYGGGIHNNGVLTLDSSTVSGNEADDGHGGGIWNYGGTVTLTNSSIVSGNKAKEGGGDLQRWRRHGHAE